MGLYTDYCITYQNYGNWFSPEASQEISSKFVSKLTVQLWMI